MVAFEFQSVIVLLYFYCTHILVGSEEEGHQDGHNNDISESCMANCGGLQGHLERLGKGQHVCLEDSVNSVQDPCEMKCGGVREQAKNQLQCFCKFCKERRPSHADFCVEPGRNQSIRAGECERLVCSGKAKYHGRFCESKDVTESGFDWEMMKKRKVCVDRCMKGNSSLERLHQGQFLCADDGYSFFVSDPCILKCSGSKHISKNQTDCFCKYCKQRSEAHLEFCAVPDEQAQFQENHCDKDVCTGRQKYFGRYCHYDEIDNV